MSWKRSVLLVLIAIWAAIFVGSYFMSARVEGPQTLDVGLKRLDILARYQIMAFAFAIATAALGFVWRKSGRRMLLLGLVPLGATALLIAVIVIAAVIFSASQQPPPATDLPPKTTAPAATAVPLGD